MENRWKINKIGLLNYWWYDEEEFDFSDGRMILRGTNGSGKSVTMQSFIPLLLDGKKTPERLDPFGNKARRIEDYVLGYGDDIKEENTSYLYMEFCKPSTQNYITIGMGLRGKRGQPINFWGFLLNDGRRIKKDFFLYKEIDNKIPLTKLKLKNRIGLGGKVVETQKEYMEMVNENIFHFETIEEYEEFIKLLIEIRTPKLSKGEGFRPSTVLEIMSNSLQGLSDEDLRPVSESIENMNKTKEQLKFLQDSKKAIDNIMGDYKKYNECVLYNKAKQYVEESKKYKEALNEQKTMQDRIALDKKEQEEVTKEIEDIEAKIKAVEFKEQELSKSEVWNQEKNLQELKAKKVEIEKNLEEKTRKKEAQEAENRRKENDIKENNSIYEEQKSEFDSVNSQIEEQANACYYDEYFFAIDEIKKDINAQYNYASLRNDLKKYIEKIEQAKIILEQVATLEKVYDEMQKNLEISKNKKIKQDNIVSQNRRSLEEEKEKFIEDMYKWESSNEILKIEQEDKVKIAQNVRNYGEKTSYDDIKLEVSNAYSKIDSKLLEKEITQKQLKTENENKLNDVKNEIEEWKNLKEPEPIREDAVVQNRIKLQEMKIPFIPLYKAVEFKEDVDETTRNNIEAALMDMGLLDALIIPKEYHNKIREIDTNFVDKYLVGDPKEFRHDLSEILRVDLPEGSDIKKEEVYNVLKTIFLDNINDENYIDENGTYKIGLLRGKADNKKVAQYIGVIARKRFKEQKIEELSKIKEQIILEIEKNNEILTKIENDRQKLKQELENFIPKDILEEKYNLLRVSINDLQSIENEIKSRQEDLLVKFEEIKEKRILLEEKTNRLQFKKTIETYKEALENVNELKDLIYELEKIHNNLINTYQKIQIIKDNLEQNLQALDDILYDINKLNLENSVTDKKIRAIEELMTDDIYEIKKQMEECIKAKEELPKKRDELRDRNVSLRKDIENNTNKNIEISEKVQNLSKTSKILQENFKIELELKYVIENYEELSKEANKILKEYQKFEKDAYPISHYLDNLSIKCRENAEYLVDYNLTIEDINRIDIDSQNIENQFLPLYARRTRKDVKCYVKGQKVNLIRLEKEVEENIAETNMLIEEDDRILFEEILTNTVGRKIRERIYHAKQWVKSMNDLMESIDTTSKLSFSLNWRPKVATDETEVDTKELVDILNADVKILRQEEVTKVANHFRSKFAKAEQRQKEEMKSFHNIMKEVLDYRTWFEFQFNYKKGNDSKKELTNNAFFKLSGGEKALAMYIPLFAAVVAKYESAGKDTPRIISLDEAFAGVDDSNIRDMFRILTKLDLEYIINSQVLWGEYDTIPSLAINELISDPRAKVVSVIRYLWNGHVRELVATD